MSKVDLTKNYFELFSLPVTYDLKCSELSCRYKTLQRQVHPDKFASADTDQQRMAMQLASHVNSAYEVLNDPLQRATYILELNNVEIKQNGATMPAEFLVEQMELREQLADAGNGDNGLHELEELSTDAAQRADQLHNELNKSFLANDYQQATQLVQKLQFIHKYLSEIRQKIFEQQSI